MRCASTLSMLLMMTLPMPVAAQASAPSRPREIPSHPGQVAFVDEGELGFVYRRFPNGQRLYTYDRDKKDRSYCTGGCASAWPPVMAAPDAVPMGEWTTVVRDNGSKQWAFRGKPVYTRFHDDPQAPVGDGLHGLWHIIPHTHLPASPEPAAKRQ